jgi:hypothetical protein
MKIPNWDKAVKEVKSLIRQHPDLIKRGQVLGAQYKDKRGLMVVDCVASRQRKYEDYVKPKLLPKYSEQALDLSLSSLAKKAPNWMPLRKDEARTMQQVAKSLINYGKKHKITDENQICQLWANNSDAHQEILDIKGIGPALLQYLRMLSGANSLKVDVQVISQLKKLGIPVEWFSVEGLLKICEDLAEETDCSLIELDQLLWHNSQKAKK